MINLLIDIVSLVASFSIGVVLSIYILKLVLDTIKK